MRNPPLISHCSESAPVHSCTVTDSSGEIIARLSAGAVAALFVVAGVDVPAGGDSDD
jgi:hypothetical protein